MHSWRCVLMWECPYTVCTCLVALVGELTFTWKSCVFPQGVLEGITLVGGGTWDGVARTRAWCALGLLLWSVAITTLSGGVRSQVAGAEALRVGSEVAQFPSTVSSPHSQQHWSKKSWLGHLVRSGALGCESPVALRYLNCLWCTTSVNASNGCPLPAQTPLWVWATSASHGRGCSLVTAALASVRSCHMRQEVLEHSLSSGQSMCWDSSRKLVSHPCILKPHSLPFIGGQGSANVLLPSRVQASHSLTVNPTGSPISQGVSSSLCWTSWLGSPICGSNCSFLRDLHSCNLPFPVRPLSGAQVLTWLLYFPSYPILCGSFLQPWLYKSLSASLQLVFSENCSTSRCIFDVFMGRGELLILLIHRLHLLYTWLRSFCPFIDISL